MSLHATDILQITRQVMPRHADFNLWDRAYSVPSLKWVTGPFAKYHFITRTPYAENRFDCEDLSLECAVMARQLHAKSTQRLNALAFGWLIYTPDQLEANVQSTPGGAHCINWFIAGKAGNERVWFFEPQRSYTVNLSNDEINSIAAVYL